MNKTLLYTVAYPQESYMYKRFFESLKKQDTKEFDFLIIQEEVDLSAYLRDLNIRVNVINVGKDTTPIKNRTLAFEYAVKKGYENIIALDIDDEMEAGRVSSIINGLEKCDLFVHDMKLIDNKSLVIQESFINKRINNNKLISYKDILYYNFIGYGNTGFKVKKMKVAFPIPDNIIAVDWWIGMSMLLSDSVGVYCDIVLSSYRQYDCNIASTYLTKDKLLQQLNVVYSHYNSIIMRFSLKEEDCISLLKDVIKDLINKCKLDSIIGDLDYCKLQQCKYLWWESIYEIVKKELS